MVVTYLMYDHYTRLHVLAHGSAANVPSAHWRNERVAGIVSSLSSVSPGGVRSNDSDRSHPLRYSYWQRAERPSAARVKNLHFSRSLRPALGPSQGSFFGDQATGA
jgi:hypothetical protein